MAEETAQNRLARETAERTHAVTDHEWPRDAFGTPLVKISASASELIPTVPYGNVTVGPIQVTRFVPATTDEQIRQGILDTQQLCERAVAEDRESVHALIRSGSTRAGA